MGSTPTLAHSFSLLPFRLKFHYPPVSTGPRASPFPSLVELLPVLLTLVDLRPCVPFPWLGSAVSKPSLVPQVSNAQFPRLPCYRQTCVMAKNQGPRSSRVPCQVYISGSWVPKVPRQSIHFRILGSQGPASSIHFRILGSQGPVSCIHFRILGF